MRGWKSPNPQSTQISRPDEHPTVGAIDLGQFANGSVLVTWVSEGQAGTVNWAVSTSTGQPVSRTAMPVSPGYFFDRTPDVAVLANDTAALVSQHWTQSNTEWRAPSGTPFQVSAALGESVQPLPGVPRVYEAVDVVGGFAVTYQSPGANANEIYELRVTVPGGS